MSMFYVLAVIGAVLVFVDNHSEKTVKEDKAA